MKQLHLKLKKEILMVEKEPTDSEAICIPLATKFKGQDLTLIGKLSDLTEWDYTQFVEDGSDIRGDVRGYKDYADFFYYKDTAKESFESAVESEGWHLKNAREDTHVFQIESEEQFNEVADFAISWQQAESRTFHPELTYIFEIAK